MENAPPWFVAFEERLDKRVNSLENKMISLENSMVSLETKLDKLLLDVVSLVDITYVYDFQRKFRALKMHTAPNPIDRVFTIVIIGYPSMFKADHLIVTFLEENACCFVGRTFGNVTGEEGKVDQIKQFYHFKKY